MQRTFDITATVRALAPVLKRNGFRRVSHRGGLFSRPKYKSFSDVVIFERGEKRVDICSDRGEVYLVLSENGRDPIRPDLECPRYFSVLGGEPALAHFTDKTINCLTSKLESWM